MKMVPAKYNHKYYYEFHKADNSEVSVLGVSNLSKEFTDVKQEIGVVLDESIFP